MGDRKPFTIAAVQACPVLLDLDASLAKACDLIAEAGALDVSLAVFPEAFLPGYPLWVWFVPPGRSVELRELYAELHANSVTVPGPVVERLGAAAREAGVAVAIGVNEREPSGGDGTLYNSILYFAPDGTLTGRHRKLVPTFAERLVWGRGDGSDLQVHSMPFARVSGLICWENYMPLARYVLAARGVEVYVAPTWDRGEPWLSSMRHIAKEMRSVVVGCCTPVRKDDIPDRLTFKQRYLADSGDWINPGDSVIVDADGKLLAGPAHEQSTILTAEVEPERIVASRAQLDVVGHYARPDVFELRLRSAPSAPIAETPTEDGASVPVDEG